MSAPKCLFINAIQYKNIDCYKINVNCPYCNNDNIHFVNTKSIYIERHCESCKKIYSIPNFK